MKKISVELVAGLLITLLAAYYWGTVGSATPTAEVSSFYKYTFRLLPYFDLAITVLGMLLFYKGLKKLKE